MVLSDLYPQPSCLSEISSTWERATFIDLLQINRIWPKQWNVVSKITLQKLYGFCLACSLLISLRSFAQEKPAIKSWGKPVEILVVSTWDLPPGSMWANCHTDSLPWAEHSQETVAMANSLTAVLSLSNISLYFSHKHITDIFIFVYFFMYLSCSLSPFPHQKLQNQVCLVQWHYKKWLAHSHSEIIIYV